MIYCKECGREINKGQKRCNYCNSRIVPLTINKVIKKTKEVSELAIQNASEISEVLVDKTAEEVKKIQKQQRKKALETKKRQIAKLQKQLNEEHE